MAGSIAGAVTAGWLIMLSAFDIRQRRLPNVLTVPGSVAVLAGAAAVGRGWPALVGALALVAVYLLVHLAVPDSLGAGDVKLAAGVGGLAGMFGPDVWVLAAVGAPILTAMVALAAMALGRRGSLPHGPSMCAATAAAVAVALV